ncbi:hypothetical protein DSM25558_2701 [Agrobacterium sp. DSM 25558]|nr:hypothetical protein DSM25558_2701 [Agrobacterium sp. DSM 25558]
MTQPQKSETRFDPAPPLINDFPSSGYVRLQQILRPQGPLPISKSGFWAGVKSGKYPPARKISERVTVWRAEDIRALIAKIEKTAR